MTEQPYSPPTPEQCRRALGNAVANEVARGWRVESQTGEQAILVKGAKPNHVLHLILSLVTCGLWLIVWLVLALTAGEKRAVVRVDEWGNVTRSDL